MEERERESMKVRREGTGKEKKSERERAVAPRCQSAIWTLKYRVGFERAVPCCHLAIGIQIQWPLVEIGIVLFNLPRILKRISLNLRN